MQKNEQYMSHFEFKKNINSKILGNVMEDIENADVRDVLKQFHVRSILPVMVYFLESKLGWLTPFLFRSIYNKAEAMTESLLNDTENKPLPVQLIQLFEKELKKKEQISLLKGIEISTEQIGTLLLQAGKRGYKISNYRFEGKPKQYTKEELPTFAYLKKDGSVEYAGDTTLSEGQIKDFINTSNFLITRILDNGKHWHCFFQNSKGLQGKESGKLGSRPHIHYLSDSFGISKEDLIKAVKNGNYPSTPVHILLVD